MTTYAEQLPEHHLHPEYLEEAYETDRLDLAAWAWFQAYCINWASANEARRLWEELGHHITDEEPTPENQASIDFCFRVASIFNGLAHAFRNNDPRLGPFGEGAHLIALRAFLRDGLTGRQIAHAHGERLPADESPAIAE